MIHEFVNDYKDHHNTHVLFWPELWQTILSCFTEMKAMDLDCLYGSTQREWLIQERMISIPCRNSWLLAVKQKSLGMLIYLWHWKITCPDLEDMIQYVTDQNDLEVLVFLTHQDLSLTKDQDHERGGFVDGEASLLNLSEAKYCPEMDVAVRKNYLSLVSFLLWRFSDHRPRLLKDPLRCLFSLMKRNALPMLKLLVPRVLLITSYNCLKAAVIKGHLDLLKYALQHMDEVDPSPPEELLILAAKHGHLKMFHFLYHYHYQYQYQGQHQGHDRQCQSHNHNILPPPPPEAYYQAFSWGHTDLCRYIQKWHMKQKYASPLYPREKDLIDACQHGHHEVLATLPDTVHIPQICLDYACKAQNAKAQNPHLIRVLKQKKS